MVAVHVLLMPFQFSETRSGQTRIEMKVQLRFGTSLAIHQAGELLTVTKEKLNLETGFVKTIQRERLQSDIGAKKHYISLGVGIDDNDHLEIPFQLHMIEHLIIEHGVLIFGLQARKARQIAPIHLAVVGLLAAPSRSLGTSVEMA